jgi:hypothetical protein
MQESLTNFLYQLDSEYEKNAKRDALGLPPITSCRDGGCSVFRDPNELTELQEVTRHLGYVDWCHIGTNNDHSFSAESTNKKDKRDDEKTKSMLKAIVQTQSEDLRMLLVVQLRTYQSTGNIEDLKPLPIKPPIAKTRATPPTQAPVKTLFHQYSWIVPTIIATTAIGLIINGMRK